eukprot:TRINITY_DN11717_c0_g1_i1.p1 TRINITY_DN11717_c0_g1~~TRINITY_DN11717_c0_g1_i1.p1  ORF type:complete len:311 (+),score=53.28 TRINITY_DN11717_c0_g1_i1:188-1120(+)
MLYLIRGVRLLNRKSLRFLSNLSETSLTTETILSKLKQNQSQEETSIATYQEPDIPVKEFDEMKSMLKGVSQSIGLGKLKEAHALAQKYLEKVNRYYDKRHPASISAVNNLALVSKMIGEYVPAKEMYLQVVQAYIEALGPSHKSTLIAMQNLANLHKNLQEYEIASRLFDELLSLRMQHFPEEKVEYAILLAQASGARREINDFAKAEEQLVKAHEILFNKYGDENVLVAMVFNQMGLLSKKQKAYSKAEDCYKRALRIQENLLAFEHPDIISTKHNLGELYYAMGEMEKSKELLEETMNSIKKSEYTQ